MLTRIVWFPKKENGQLGEIRHHRKSCCYRPSGNATTDPRSGGKTGRGSGQSMASDRCVHQTMT